MINDSFKLNFVGIGAPRSGTTWLTQCLAEHPDICMSTQKELDFFKYDSRYSQGIPYLRKQFEHCNSSNKKGEWSVDYLYSHEAAERIKKHNANVRLLVCLRNPVDRAYSHYLLKKYSASIMPLYSASYALSPRDKYDYIKMGHYSKHLSYYFSLFPKENIHIMLYDDIISKPLEVVQKLYTFLGVRSDFQPPSINQYIDYRASKKFYSLYAQSVINILSGVYKKSSVKKILNVFKMREILRALNQANRRKVFTHFIKPPMDNHLGSRLKKIYKEDIEETEKLIGKELDLWK